MEATLEELKESAEATQRAFSILFGAGGFIIIIWGIKKVLNFFKNIANPDEYDKKANKEIKESLNHGKKAIGNKILAKITRKIKLK